MSNLLNEAVALDLEAVKLARDYQSTFMKIGKVMDQITDERELWRLLTDSNGEPFRSQEQWVQHRFRSNRSSAFEAREYYRSLKDHVPDVVIEQIPRKSLRVFSNMPDSAKKSLEIQELAVMSSPAEFLVEAVTRYPKHFLDQTMPWGFNPTMAQAANYNRIWDECVMPHYNAETRDNLTKENAFEIMLHDFENSYNENMRIMVEKQTKGATIQ